MTFKPYIHQLNDIIDPGPKFHITNTMDEIRILNYGSELEYLKSLFSYVRKTDVFYDIGASLGLVSLHAVMLGYLVHSYEPDPELYDALLKNAELNYEKERNYYVINPFPIAIGKSSFSAPLFTDGAQGKSPTMIKGGNYNKSITTKVTSIDNEVYRLKLDRPDVIKIDVEGMEWDVIVGMQNLLRSGTPPRIIGLEIHPAQLQKTGILPGEILAELNALDYEIMYEEERANESLYIFHKIGEEE